MAHVFISYVRENENEVHRLANDLTQQGVEIWLDKTKLSPGKRWQDSIRESIDKGDFFIACFSEQYNRKNESYMNTEIGLAIERLQRIAFNRAWFIPVLFSGEIPQWSIGGGETLHALQWVELTEDNWNEGIQKILKVIRPTLVSLRSTPIANLSEEDANKMITDKNFFDTRKHPGGTGIEHRYEYGGRKAGKVVFDRTTDLVWQESTHTVTSLGELGETTESWTEGKRYIEELNRAGFGGFTAWRLPTLEEAMSLMEPTQNELGLHISSIYDQPFTSIWTSDTIDTPSYSLTWCVSYKEGYCSNMRAECTAVVRAVCSRDA